MYGKLSTSRQKILDISQSYWRRANLHPANMMWRTEAIKMFGLYDGSEQWDPVDKQKVLDKGQVPLTINLIQGRIDSLSGVEIQSRFRTAVQNASGNAQNDILAKALTSQFYFIQQDQKIPHKGSLKFRHMLTCGLGWSGLYQQDSNFVYDHIHPFNIIPDYDDLSEQFENMKFVCRKRWMEPDTVKKMWPKSSKDIDFTNPDLCSTVYSPEIIDRSSNFTDPGNFSGYSQSRVLVCEVQYKTPKTSYSGIDSNGFFFETFDEGIAEQMANSSKDIEERPSTQIMRALFVDNFLLEAAPLNPNIPGLKDFTYIPCVWKRRTKDGVPYGLVDSMKSLQIDYNVRMTKALYTANSSRLIVSGILPPGTTPEVLTRQLKSQDQAIVLPPDSKFELRDNAPLTDVQLKIADNYDKQFQRVTGIYDDMMGRETNASSGVAQRQRQINSVRNQVFAFDNFADMKEREARFMLALFQGGENENILAEIMSEEEKESIILNLTRTIKGKKVIFNDVRTLPVSLEIEEVPDYKSSMEENRAALENLLSNPNAMMIMQSPTLMRRLGIRDYQALSDEMKQTMASQKQGSPGVSPPPGGGSQPANQDMKSLAYPGM